MAAALRKPGPDRLSVTLEVDDAQLWALTFRLRVFQASRNALPVRFLQRGARKHRVLSLSGDRAHLGGDAVKPRFAILVGQRNALGHLGDIRWRMKIVGVEKRPGKLIRKRLADGALTAAANAHDDDNHDFA
jgi:hypothetical protein